jgi:hypothetical protein
MRRTGSHLNSERVDSRAPARSVASPCDQCSLSTGVPARRLDSVASPRTHPRPSGFAIYVTRLPSASFREQGIRHLVDADSGKFPREAYLAITPFCLRFGASASSLSDLRSLVTKVLFSPRVDHGPCGTSLNSTNFQSVTSVSFNPR